MSNIKDLVHEDFEKLKNNREEYFDIFYKNNYDLVYRICYSVLKDKDNSEDATQNVFVKIFKISPDKMPSEYESSWLYTVSKNEALQLIRKNKSNVEQTDELENIKSEVDDIKAVIDNEEYNKIVKKLNRKQEQIISLKVISDFTFKEIGQIMSMPTATVQWHYYRSIKSLKIALSNLAMFFVAFILGINMYKKEESSNQRDTYKKQDHNAIDDTEEEANYSSETSSSVSSETSSNDKHEDKDVDAIISSTSAGNEMDSTRTTIEFDQQTLVFSLAGIFLIVSIISLIIFTKHQQKEKNKTSKK